MFGDFDKYILVLLTGLVVSYLLTPVVKMAAFRWGVVDMPNERRPHQRPTARGGGVALFIAVQVACLLAVAFPWANKLAGELDFHWWWHFAVASSVLFVVGIIDDVRGLRPLIKLAGQTLAALLMAIWDTHFGPILNYNLPAPVDSLLVIIWLVAIVNAFNLIDGLDGLASGLAIISAVGLCGILAIQPKPADVLVLLGFIGACLGFLRYNFHPASIFMGDTGSMFIGFTLGVFSLQTLTKDSFVISLTIPMLVLGVPIYDAVLAIWRRSVRKWAGNETGVKRGIMQPDLEHLHHRLKFAGLSTRRVATYLCVLNGALVMVGLLIALYQSRAAGIFLIALLVGAYLLMRHLAVIELRETGKAFLMGLRRPTHSAFKALAYVVCDMLWLAASLALIMWAVEQQPPEDFWRTWYLDLPVWVTPTFSLLAISRAYVTYWPRARLRDVISLVFWLEVGILFSLALALLIDPSHSEKWVIRAILVAAISHPVIVASRVVYRCIEELALWIRRQNDAAGGVERVLLYGAGARAQLFLKDCATRNSKTPDRRVTVGLIDDETALHYQWIYGHLVLGGIKELPHLIAKWKINRIIVVADLLPDNWKTIQEVTRREGIRLSEWISQEHEIGQAKPKTAAVLEAFHGTS